MPANTQRKRGRVDAKLKRLLPEAKKSLALCALCAPPLEIFQARTYGQTHALLGGKSRTQAPSLDGMRLHSRLPL